MENKEEYQLSISFAQDDFYGNNLKPYSVMQKFQQIATDHANLLGLDYYSMLKKNLLWVIMRIKYKIEELPKPEQKLILITYPLAKNVLEFDRDFIITDQNGKIFIRATSKWCLIDKTTRRLSRMTNIDYPFIFSHKGAFDEKFLKTESFVPTTAPDYSYQVSEEDIDLNGHMNNTMYSKVIFELLKNSTIKIDTFQVNFLREAMLGNRIDIYQKVEENGINYLGKLCEGETCFTAYAKK